MSIGPLRMVGKLASRDASVAMSGSWEGTGPRDARAMYRPTTPRATLSALLAVALVAGCASPATKEQHRIALDACLAAPDPSRAPACERANILRQQMDYERSENASIAMGALALSVLTLGIVSVFDDDDHYYYGGHNGYKRRHW